MPEGALFIGWGKPIPTRETAGLDVFKESKEYFDGLRKKNEITGFEPVLLSNIGGPLRGFFLLRGDPVKISTLTSREEFVRLVTKASLVCEHVIVAPAYVGDSMTTMIDTYRNTVNTLALQHEHV